MLPHEAIRFVCLTDIKATAKAASRKSLPNSAVPASERAAVAKSTIADNHVAKTDQWANIDPFPIHD